MSLVDLTATPVEEPEIVEEVEYNPITQSMVRESLSMVCKTGAGLDYAYIRFELKSRDLSDVVLLQPFVHLRYVDLSGNKLRDLSPLKKMTFLLSLKVQDNLLRQGLTREFKHLQLINISNNKMSSMSGLNHSRLKTLNLANNRFRYVMPTLERGRLSNLTTLYLQGNKLKSTLNLVLPSLEKLFLADNSIDSLEGLDNLVKLKMLHLRSNSIQQLDGFSGENAALEYLNLRNNAIQRMSELRKLSILPALKVLIVSGNEVFVTVDNLPLEVLMMLPHLERLDKSAYTAADRMDARQMLIEQAQLEMEMEDEPED